MFPVSLFTLAAMTRSTMYRTRGNYILLQISLLFLLRWTGQCAVSATTTPSPVEDWGRITINENSQAICSVKEVLGDPKSRDARGAMATCTVYDDADPVLIRLSNPPGPTPSQPLVMTNITSRADCGEATLHAYHPTLDRFIASCTNPVRVLSIARDNSVTTLLTATECPMPYSVSFQPSPTISIDAGIESDLYTTVLVLGCQDLPNAIAPVTVGLKLDLNTTSTPVIELVQASELCLDVTGVTIAWTLQEVHNNGDIYATCGPSGKLLRIGAGNTNHFSPEISSGIPNNTIARWYVVNGKRLFVAEPDYSIEPSVTQTIVGLEGLTENDPPMMLLQWGDCTDAKLVTAGGLSAYVIILCVSQSTTYLVDVAQRSMRLFSGPEQCPSPLAAIVTLQFAFFTCFTRTLNSNSVIGMPLHGTTDAVWPLIREEDCGYPIGLSFEPKAGRTSVYCQRESKMLTARSTTHTQLFSAGCLVFTDWRIAANGDHLTICLNQLPFGEISVMRLRQKMFTRYTPGGRCRPKSIAYDIENSAIYLTLVTDDWLADSPPALPQCPHRLVRFDAKTAIMTPVVIARPEVEDPSFCSWKDEPEDITSTSRESERVLFFFFDMATKKMIWACKAGGNVTMDTVWVRSLNTSPAGSFASTGVTEQVNLAPVCQEIQDMVLHEDPEGGRVVVICKTLPITLQASPHLISIIDLAVQTNVSLSGLVTRVTDCPRIHTFDVSRSGLLAAACGPEDYVNTNLILLVNLRAASPAATLKVTPVDARTPISCGLIRLDSATEDIYCGVQLLGYRIFDDVWFMNSGGQFQRSPSVIDAIYNFESKAHTNFLVRNNAVFASSLLTGTQSAIVVHASHFRCMAGYSYSTDSDAVCVACESSTDRSFGVDGNTAAATSYECLACRIGYVATLAATSSCAACAAGTYAQDNVCIQCPAGQYQRHPGNTTCEFCPLGRYAETLGMSECSPCPVGRYAEQPGAVQCSSCAAGEYQLDQGKSACLICAAGKYSRSNAAICIDCDIGSYASNNRSGSCDLCGRGSASNLFGLDQPCPDCPRGFYQDRLGQSICKACTGNFYSDVSGAPSCSLCEVPSIVNVNHTACARSTCSANRRWNFTTNACEKCPISTYSLEGSAACATCAVDSYTPEEGSGCISCSMKGMEGLACTNGLAYVRAEYFAIQVYNEQLGLKVFQTHKCPRDYCPGGPLQISAEAEKEFGIADSVQYCAFPRRNSPDNLLCGDCVDGYIPWGENCVPCVGPDDRALSAGIILSFLLVLFLLQSTPSAAGLVVVLIYFCQIAALEVIPIADSLEWTSIANFGPKSSPSCLAELAPYHQMLLDLLMPFGLLLAMIIIFIGHMSVYWLWKRCSREDLSPSVDRRSAGEEASMSLFSKVVSVVKERITNFRLSQYIGCACQIVLFCYVQVSVASIGFLNCIDVGDQRLLFTAPTVDCRSSTYQAYLVPAVLSLIFYVIGVPMFIFVWLGRHRAQIACDTEESSSIPSTTSTNGKDALSNSTSPSVTGTNTAALASSRDRELSQFAVRWGALYMMFNSGSFAWQGVVLLRRAFFVLIAIFLVQEPALRFMAYTLVHFGSLQLHAYVQPFRSPDVNRAESLAEGALLIMSAFLTGHSTPYPIYAQAIVFLLLLVPVVIFVGQIIHEEWATVVKELRARFRGKEDPTELIQVKTIATSPMEVAKETIELTPASPSGGTDRGVNTQDLCTVSPVSIDEKEGSSSFDMVPTSDVAPIAETTSQAAVRFRYSVDVASDPTEDLQATSIP